MTRSLVVVVLLGLFLSVVPSFSQTGGGSAFARGEKLYLYNKPAEALPLLEQAVREDPANLQAQLYLGIVYEQLNQFDRAIDVYRKALPRGGAQQAWIAFRLGDVFVAKGAAAFAEQYYSQAITLDPTFSAAYLNRANARVKASALKDAVSDYQTYLTLVPDSPKRPKIEQLIALIGESFAAQERDKLAQAEAAKAEEERKKKLLEEVSDSLKAASEETKGLQAGSEDVKQYDGEFELQ